ncbi:type VI secretion system protein ImpG [Brucella endophytica]|uniref:Type VI secretion system protein ImpG n=1 Tax=Brucella endophytica TaxID=1963359 RepID=A0A916S8H7_9HYPH|nr:type VI secretion system baseplate subunit TssF [Brucella endophytica]GGA88209.1 type VI secretion system protein ImpG [Brucella endophytica]
MNERFLQRYNEELAALRRKAARFADAFPKIAGRLRLTADVADDPQVERMIQSFAYSAARVRQKIDDEFPELTTELLEALYPHFLAPLPSMSIVRFEPSEQLGSVQKIPRLTEISSEPVAGETCRFRTTQDVEIAPVRLVSAKLSGQPIEAPVSPFAGAAGCLHLSLRMLEGRPSLRDIGLKRLRLYLAAPWRQATQLYELLCNHGLGIAVARHASDIAPRFLDRSNLRPAGFDPEEAMLPYPAVSFTGYRLLTEFFALPQKFLFIDLDNIEALDDERLEIFIYLKETDRELERSVSAQDFALHATPIINLYRQACEPLTIDGTRTEYRLLPDARRHHTREIYSVERVLLSDADGRERFCQPFFGRTQTHESTPVFWQIARHYDEDDKTTDVDITFVDRERRPTDAVQMTASVDTLCTNRDLAEKLPFGGGHPYLNIVPGNDSVAATKALMPPTPVIRRAEHTEREWRLISHLLLNHASLSDKGGAALKDILSLYSVRDTPETRFFVDSLQRVETKSATARMKGGAVVPGTDVTIEFDPGRTDHASAFLFGSVLDHFLSLYTSINSFTRLTVKLRGQSRPVASWPARAAARPLL